MPQALPCRLGRVRFAQVRLKTRHSAPHPIAAVWQGQIKGLYLDGKNALSIIAQPQKSPEQLLAPGLIVPI
jgi:hypothetical protein